MAFVPVDNVCQVTMTWSTSATFVGQNTIYFLRNELAAWNEATMGDLLAELQFAFENIVTKPWSNNINISGWAARDLSTQFGASAVLAGTSDTFGDESTALLPANATIAISFGTGFVGRSFRGRVYQCGLCEGQVTNNSLLTTPAGLMITAWQGAIEEAEPTAGATHVVVSRQLNNVPLNVGMATPVTSYTLRDTRIDTQRRRLKHYA